MTIQELANRAGVTTRTIRYYVEQGVLPQPNTGRPAEYTERHMRLLDLIRRLKEQYLPLEEIKSMLGSLTEEQVESFLDAHTPAQRPAETEPTADSASDYIAQIMSRGAMRQQLKEQSLPPMPSPAVVPETQPAPQMLPGATTTPSPAAKRAREPATSSPSRYEHESGAGATIDSDDAYKSDGRPWQRVPVAPGVEVHYKVPHQGQAPGLVAHLLEAAKRFLAEGPEESVEDKE